MRSIEKKLVLPVSDNAPLLFLGLLTANEHMAEVCCIE